MKKRNSIISSILVLFFLSFSIMLRQLSSPGYVSVNINDTFAYASWAWQFTKSIKEGLIYPRWMPLNFWGYGSPTFIFYPPIAFYLTALLDVFTNSVIVAMNIVKFLALFLSGIGMFFLVKEFFSQKTAFLSAAFYLVFPFNIFELYFAGTFTSIVSLMWLSPIVLFVYRYFKSERYKYLLLAGVCYGGLILTHPINAYMFSLVVAALVVYLSIVRSQMKGLIAIPLTAVTGLSISSAYVLPLVYERRYVNSLAFIGEGGGFHYGHFFLLPDMTWKFPADHFWPAYYTTYIFFSVFFSILLILFSNHLRRLRRTETMGNAYKVSTFFFVTAVSSLFLLFGVCELFWETIPYFKYIQFPVRWLNISTFAVVFLSSSGFWAAEKFYGPKIVTYSFIGVLFLVCLLLDVKYINAAHVFSEKELIPVQSVDWTPEHLPSGVDLGKLDKDGDPAEKASIISGTGRVEIAAWKSAERVMQIAVDEPVVLRVRTFNYPGWTAYIDGAHGEIRTEKGTDAILVNVPRGRHTIILRFVDTPVRFFSKVLSLLAFFMISFAAFLSGRSPTIR